jgi:hypothetical protein
MQALVQILQHTRHTVAQYMHALSNAHLLLLLLLHSVLRLFEHSALQPSCHVCFATHITLYICLHTNIMKLKTELLVIYSTDHAAALFMKAQREGLLLEQPCLLELPH